jgi:lysophospholipase L1-like esterase
VAALLAFVAAFIWQTQTKITAIEPNSTINSNIMETRTDNSSQYTIEETQTENKSINENNTNTELSSSISGSDDNYSGIKTESSDANNENSGTSEMDGVLWERVGEEYFDDAAFVGDSITTGIKLYGIMDNANVFAGTGIRLENIAEKKIVKINNEEVTIFEALNSVQPKKIYIMMGANSLGAANETVLALYERLIDKLLTSHPNSIIYVQSVLPLYEPLFKIKYNKDITNLQIASFNVGLKALASQKDIYYLNIAEEFCDENGAMPEEFTPDGIHIHSAQYQRWFEYLKSHAIVKASSGEQK